MGTTRNKVELTIPCIPTLPINSFELPDANLCFRGDSSHAIESDPDDFVSYNIDLNNDDYISQYLFFNKIDDKYFYLNLAQIEFNAEQLGKSCGNFHIAVKIVRAQYIDGVDDLRDKSQLLKAQSYIFAEEYKNDSNVQGPDFKFIDINGMDYLSESATVGKAYPRHIFFRPIDHRHALMIDVTFEGFVPMGTPFPLELHEACMDVIKDFLSHIELSPRD